MKVQVDRYKPRGVHLGSDLPHIIAHAINEHRVQSLQSFSSSHDIRNTIDRRGCKKNPLRRHDSATPPMVSSDVVSLNGVVHLHGGVYTPDGQEDAHCGYSRNGSWHVRGRDTTLWSQVPLHTLHDNRLT